MNRSSIVGHLQYQFHWAGLSLLARRVEVPDIFPVAVVELRFHAVARVNQALGRLRPARVRHVRVHVRFERIFSRLQSLPKGLRLRGDELDLYHRLDALVTILPRHGNADWGAVLLWQWLAVNAAHHH